MDIVTHSCVVGCELKIALDAIVPADTLNFLSRFTGDSYCGSCSRSDLTSVGSCFTANCTRERAPYVGSTGVYSLRQPGGD